MQLPWQDLKRLLFGSRILSALQTSLQLKPRFHFFVGPNFSPSDAILDLTSILMIEVAFFLLVKYVIYQNSVKQVQI